MNIQNLNPQELAQLQILLNKMNPTPTEIDPVEKMIQNIMENFNFEKTQRAMDLLDWKWRDEYVTEDMLREEAERLLRGAIKSRLGDFKSEHHEVAILNECGGLEAKAWCNEAKTKIIGIQLDFILNSWDESIEE
jgi:hypothetical protein